MKHVLFVCTHNAGRSQMAKAFWDKHAPDDVRAESAGQEPAKAPWPEVVEVMREIGIDISKERPKKLSIEMQLQADWAITLGCSGSCPYVPTRVDDWQIPDPHGRSLERGTSDPRHRRRPRPGLHRRTARCGALRLHRAPNPPRPAPAAAQRRVLRDPSGRGDPKLRRPRAAAVRRRAGSFIRDDHRPQEHACMPPRGAMRHSGRCLNARPAAV